MKSIDKIIHNQTLTFDFRKVVFWKETSSLILSDVHVGKITHFRKNGISIPSFPYSKNLNILKSAIKDYNPKQVVFLGDLFHSDYNLEWEEWLTFFRTSKISSRIESLLFLLFFGFYTDILLQITRCIIKCIFKKCNHV